MGTYWHGAMVTPYYNVLRQSKTGWNNEAGNQKCILHDEEKGRLWFSNESCKAKGEKIKHGGCTESFFTNYSSISHKHLTNIQSINCVVNGPMIFWTITMTYIHLNAILHVWSKCSNKNYTKKNDFQLLEELIDAFQLYKKCTVLTRLKSSSAADQASRDCLVVML